jgi:hypothetical protein
MKWLVGLWVALGGVLYGQQPKLDTLCVKSSVVCQKCRRTIIKGAFYAEGDSWVEVDVPTND